MPVHSSAKSTSSLVSADRTVEVVGFAAGSGSNAQPAARPASRPQLRIFVVVMARILPEHPCVGYCCCVSILSRSAEDGLMIWIG